MQIILSPLVLYYSLWDEVTMHSPHLKDWGVMLHLLEHNYKLCTWNFSILLLSQSFIYIDTDSWLLMLASDCNQKLCCLFCSKLFQLWLLGTLPVGSHVPFKLIIGSFLFLKTSLLSCTTDAPGSYIHYLPKS